MSQVENIVVAEALSNGEGLTAIGENNIGSGDMVGMNDAGSNNVEMVGQTLVESRFEVYPDSTSKHPKI